MIGKIIPNIRKSSTVLWIVRVVVIAVIVMNFAFVWHNSSKVSKESDKTSKKIATGVATVTVEDYDKLTKPQQKKHVNIINSKVRSIAHVAEFVPLGFSLFILALSIFDLMEKKMYQKILVCLIFALFFTLGAALSDELHQLFVKGRTFQAIDILSDTLGSLAGCLLALIPTYVFRHKI